MVEKNIERWEGGGIKVWRKGKRMEDMGQKKFPKENIHILTHEKFSNIAIL